MFANLLKFILGIFLALSVLAGAGVAATMYFINRTTIPPAKPVFANDSEAVKASAPKPTTEQASANPKNESKPTQSPTPSPTSTPTQAAKELPPGAYQARVSWPKGLSLRSQPGQDSEKVGGVGFNEKIVVLEESSDKAWQKIRVEGSNQEGWVKKGNTRRTEGEEANDSDNNNNNDDDSEQQ